MRKPKRVLVRFVDDTLEGLEDWVPPARLKVAWDEREEFITRERRWDEVTSLSPDRDDVELSAAGIVIGELVEPGVAEEGWNATGGVLFVHDLDALTSLLGLDRNDLEADPLSFTEDGDLVVSWPTFLAIAKRAASRDPEAILDYVERREFEARRSATYGKQYRSRRSRSGDYIDPEICARVDAEHGKPVRALLRQWCGAGPTKLRDEIAMLRSESRRAAKLLREATAALRDRGHTRVANRIDRQFEEADD